MLRVVIMSLIAYDHFGLELKAASQASSASRSNRKDFVPIRVKGIVFSLTAFRKYASLIARYSAASRMFIHLFFSGIQFSFWLIISLTWFVTCDKCRPLAASINSRIVISDIRGHHRDTRGSVLMLSLTYTCVAVTLTAMAPRAWFCELLRWPGAFPDCSARLATFSTHRDWRVRGVAKPRRILPARACLSWVEL